MSRWRPRLVVRRSRGGGIASPTTTGGFLFFGWIGLLLAGSTIFAATRQGDWWVLLAVLVSFWPIRDAWAWLAATDEERAVFLSELARLQNSGAGRSPSHVEVGKGGRAELPLLGLLGTATCLAGAFLNRGFFVPGMVLVALAILGAWETARRSRASP